MMMAPGTRSGESLGVYRSFHYNKVATKTVTTTATKATFPPSPLPLGTLLLVELRPVAVALEPVAVNTVEVVPVLPAVAETEMTEPDVTTVPQIPY